MNWGDIRNMVYLHLREAQIDNDLVTPSVLLSATNTIYAQLLTETECMIQRVSQLVESGSSVGVYTLPAGMFKVRSVEVAPLTSPLQNTTMRSLGFTRPAYRQTAAGMPLDVAMFDSTSYLISPKPSAEYGPITVEGPVTVSDAVGALVPSLASDSDVPAFNTAYHMALVYGTVEQVCAGFLLTNATAEKKSVWAGEQYKRLLNGLKTYAEALLTKPE